MQPIKEELENCPCGSCSFGWANAQECKEGDCQDICSDYKKWKEDLKGSEFEECPYCRSRDIEQDEEEPYNWICHYCWKRWNKEGIVE